MTTISGTGGQPDHELGALPEERPCGEDHRDGHPGYDLDEQAVYTAELRRRDAAAGRQGTDQGPHGRDQSALRAG